MDLSLVPYQQHTSKSNNFLNLLNVQYKECMKNHAASIGRHASDGCGEFMPPSDHSLTCAACGCHRNFHRREGSPGVGHLFLHPPNPPPFLHRKHCDVDDADDHDRRSETPERGELNLGRKNKRFRTKFSQEQKDKMLEFAEKIGWRLNKNDDMALNRFCNEIGVKRNVLKVWMHNNKNAHRRRDSTSPSSTPVVAAPTTQPVGV